MTRKKLYVLLGDVINSRTIRERKNFEKKLQAALEWATLLYSSTFKAPVTKWKGLDEIAAIIHDPQNIYDMMKGINEMIYPNKIRFVLVHGNIELIKNKPVSELDGDAFHKAASLMNELKKEKFIFKCSGITEDKDRALENQINMGFLMKSKWTKKQALLYSLYYKNGSQEATAKKLKISQQSVSKTLKSINGFEVIQLEKRINNWILTYYRSAK